MIAEFARFTVKTDTERFLSLRAEAVQAVKRAHPGLVAAPLLVESGVMHQPGFGELAAGELGTGEQRP
jgi:hypothetical protein